MVRVAALFLLVSAVVLAGPRWETNTAYLDLSRAVTTSARQPVERFTRWMQYGDQNHRSSESMGFGIVLLVAKGLVDGSPELLREWLGAPGRLDAGTARGQLAAYALARSWSGGDPTAVLDAMSPAMAASWLLFGAEARPGDSERLLGILESRGLEALIPHAEGRRLGEAYAQLADRKRQAGASAAEVLSLAEKALELDPGGETGTAVKAMALHRQGRSQAGLDLLRGVVGSRPKSILSWEAMAYIKLETSDFQGAEDAARVAIGLAGPGARVDWAQSLLAAALISQSRCSEALPFAEQPIQVVPGAPNYLLVLADAYWCTGTRQRAQSLYQQLETLAPGYAPYVRERLDAGR